jgi:hypothetical protein
VSQSRSWFAMLAAIAIASPAAAETPVVDGNSARAPYPTVEVLKAVSTACARLKLRSDTLKDLTGNGWSPVTLPEDSPLGKLLAMGKAAGGEMLKADSGKMDEPVVFAKTVAGEDLKIILSAVSMEGIRVSGCRMYDVGETRPMPVADVTKWIGRDPERNETNDALSIATWRAGLAKEHDSFDLYFVPEKSPLVEVLKVSGIAIRVDQIGKAE